MGSIKAARLLVEIVGDNTSALRKMKETDQQVAKSKKSLDGTVQGIERGMAGAAVATAAGFGLAVVTTMNFDKRMSAVAAKANASTKDLAAMRDAAIDLGAKTVYSASEAAAGMENLAAAGLGTKEIITAMPGLLDAAAASGEDFAVTSDIMVSTMGQFGLAAKDMGHIGDVLAKAANMSTINMVDLGLSLKYAGPVAKALGLSLEETSSALVVLGNNGIKADNAGTALRMGFMRLNTIGPKVEKRLGAVGKGLQGLLRDAPSLDEKLGVLRDRLEGLSRAEKVDIVTKLFGAEAAPAFLILLDQTAGSLDKVAGSLENSNGEAKKAADVMTDNLWGAIEQLKGGAESAAIAVGTALTPQMRNLADSLSGAVDWFNKLSPAQQQVYIQWIALMGGFAAGVVTVIKVGQGILALRAALIGLEAASGPVGLLWAAVGLLGGAIAGATTSTVLFNDGVSESGAVLQTAADAAREYKTVMDELRGAVLDVNEADLAYRTALAAKERATADRRKVQAEYKEGSPELRDALLREEQATLAVTRAMQRKNEASRKGTEAEARASEVTRKKIGREQIAARTAGKLAEKTSDLIVPLQRSGESASTATAKVDDLASGWGSLNTNMRKVIGAIKDYNGTTVQHDPDMKVNGDGLGWLMPSVGSGSVAGLTSHTGSMASQAMSMFGLSVSSGRRPGAITASGNTSLHASGRGVDLVGTPAQKAAAFRYFTANGGRFGLYEAINQHSIWKPGRGTYNWPRNDHMDHLHLGFAMEHGGIATGPTLALLAEAGGAKRHGEAVIPLDKLPGLIKTSLAMAMPQGESLQVINNFSGGESAAEIEQSVTRGVMAALGSARYLTSS